MITEGVLSSKRTCQSFFTFDRVSMEIDCRNEKGKHSLIDIGNE